MADRLLLDAMCGKLARYLRMCGYDAAYVLDGRDSAPSDDAVVERARETGRRVVTRDRDLADRLDDAVLLTERDIADQLRELAEAGFDLSLPDEPTRCGACNGSLVSVDADEATPDGAPDPASDDVWRCEACGQHFWTGSHWDDVAATLARV